MVCDEEEKMKWIKRLFGLKEKEQVVEEVEDLGEETSMECDYCKMSIYAGQRVKTYGGKKFHMKPCWYKLRKDAKATM